MADDDDSQSGISEESKIMLEEHVKKGKARKFILICKGAAIKTLIVFKKGPYAPKITQAKKEGFRGEAIVGIITGKGVNIELQLAGNAEVSAAMKTDGNVYTAEPVKTAKLRKFLVEEAELKFKPEFKIITQAGDLASVNESDEDNSPNDLNAQPAEATTPPPDAPPPPPPPSSGNDAQRDKLVAALKNITPLIQQAVVDQPGRKQEILGPVASIKQNIQSDNLDQAKQELLAYVPFLKGLASENASGGPPPPPTAPPPPPTSDDRKQKLIEALKKLQPHIVKAIAAAPAREGEIKASIGQIRDEIKGEQYEEATQNIKAFSKFILSLGAQTAPSDGESSAPAKEVSFVKMQQSRLAWVTARNTVRSELETLESKILEVCRDEPDFQEIADDAKSLYSILESLDERLIDRLDEGLNAPTPEERHVKNQAATKVLQEYLTFLKQDPLVNDIDDNPFQKVKVYSTLRATLSELQKNLT